MNNIRKNKRIIAFAAIIFLAVLVELVSNRNALKNAYDRKDISDHIYVIDDTGKEQYQVVFSDKKGCFIQKICLKGTFKDRKEYTIETKQINEFGKEIEEQYNDVVNHFCSEFSTNINRKVTYLKITLPKSESVTLNEVYLANKIDINIYRIFFVLLVGLLVYCLFFEKSFLKNVEWYFVIFSLSFGMLIILSAQPTCHSWDEQIHFKNTYKIASGKTVEWSEAALVIAERADTGCNTKEEYKQLKEYMNQHGEGYVLREIQETNEISYISLAYIPMAIFLKIGKFFHMPFSNIFAFGKIGNLVTYVFIMFWAIYLAKSKKIFLAFIAMLPTPIFLAASYTYDSVVFSFITLACVLWAREVFFKKDNYHKVSVIAAIFFMAIGSLSKAVYIPLLLLMLMLPQFYKRSKKEQIEFIIGIGMVFLVVMSTFVLPIITSTVSGNISYGGDTRVGDTSAVRQLISMLKHPVSSAGLLIRSIVDLDNFRNIGNYLSDNYFFGNLMFLNYSTLGTLSDKWSILLLPSLTILMFFDEPENENITQEKTWKKVYMWMILGVTVVLIWSALYLSFTPVGENKIDGVQARYYLPLLYLAALLVTNNKVKVNMKKYSVTKFAFFIAVVLQAVAAWELLIKSRLL